MFSTKSHTVSQIVDKASYLKFEKGYVCQVFCLLSEALQRH